METVRQEDVRVNLPAGHRTTPPSVSATRWRFVSSSRTDPFMALQFAFFQKAEVSGPVEDDVIEQFKTENCCRCLELSSDGEVAR